MVASRPRGRCSCVSEQDIAPQTSKIHDGSADQVIKAKTLAFGGVKIQPRLCSSTLGHLCSSFRGPPGQGFSAVCLLPLPEAGPRHNSSAGSTVRTTPGARVTLSLATLLSQLASTCVSRACARRSTSQFWRATGLARPRMWPQLLMVAAQAAYLVHYSNGERRRRRLGPKRDSEE